MSEYYELIKEKYRLESEVDTIKLMADMINDMEDSMSYNVNYDDLRDMCNLSSYNVNQWNGECARIQCEIPFIHGWVLQP